ncbi:MAG TPA: carboxypeptidase-like regulatory domain-containing protein [Thermoanaerobaculia bacterium]|nr:carboxypeptidase-like regulatory domain-containing protein [Thermoanaerobaculia bacterium]
MTAGEERDLGAIGFEPGASVAGTIIMPRGRHEDTVVELVPEPAAASSPLDKAPSGTRRVVMKDSSGELFQFTGVPAGRYRLSASRPGWLPAEVKTIRVEEGHESFLEVPIQLAKGALVDVFITPPMSTEEEPWTVRIESGAAVASNKPIAESAALFSGEWRNDALYAGKYMLSVVDRQGSTFLRETVEASSDSAPRFLNILKIHVHGTVTVGTAPFESRLVFTDDEGSSKITLNADAAGSFDGILPHEGRWQVQVRNAANTYYVKDVAVDIKRTSEQAVATVFVKLPGGKVRGRVTNEAGEPAEADVIVFRDGRGIADALVLPDGSFELDGLDPVPVTLQAVAHGAESDVVSYLAADDDPTRAELVLRKLLDVKCQLLTEDGYPIAGAVIRYIGAGMERQHQALSGPTGEFSLRVPQGTLSLLAAIVAPGFPVSLRPLDPGSTDTQRIILGTASASLHIVQRPGAPWPFVTLDGQSFLSATSLLALAIAEGLPGLVDDGLEVRVSPGIYTICYGGKREGACQSAGVAAGRQQTFFPGEGPAK